MKKNLTGDLFGHDAELATPEHDRIMLALDAWCRDATRSGPRLLPRASRRIEREEVKRYQASRWVAAGEGDWPFDWRCETLTWEPPGRQGARVVRFGDLLAEFTWHHRRRLNADGTVDDQCGHATVLFEVKPQIRSLGELLRQLQLYRTLDWHAPDQGWRVSAHVSFIVVVAPRAALNERVLCDQGFMPLAVEELSA